jgi:hypothetical protein
VHGRGAAHAQHPAGRGAAGGSIGLGLTTTVFTTASEDELQKDLAATRLSNDEVDALHGALAGTDTATGVLARFRGETGDRLVELVREAFAAGMQRSFRLVALLALGRVIVSVLGVGGSLVRPGLASKRA